MKRLDLLFAIALVVLAAFVGGEVYALRTDDDARHVVRAEGRNATDDPVPPRSDARRPTRVRNPVPARLGANAERHRSPAEVRSRLELSSPGTFIGEVLAAHDSALARWPDRNGQPLRVWIQPVARLRHWSPASVSIVRDAFVEWSQTGIPLQFTFVLDSASADVRVTWVDRFNEPISGKTLWSHDDQWWILEAGIVLAVHHRNGEPLDSSATRAIALHEVGHLIGLDHTTDTTSIMTPRVRVKSLAPADRATAQLLYLLPPGPIGGSRAARR